jgi:dihydrofolate synthase/folylpolyglutamate synthase
MTYPEILDHIFQSFPMYHRVGSAAYKEGLENIEQLAEMAGHPEKKLKAIHVAGTNGKGSVAHLLASYFQELGWKTGLFTSPHLIDFRERIKINGAMLSEQNVIDFFEKYNKQIAEIEPSFFEITTILAFDFFANENVDIAIIEVGLGGRLDATNILSPILSVITNISLDHTKLLGNSLPEIAYEKAGIIKENTPVVIGEYHPETFSVFEKIARSKNAPLFLADEYHGDLQFGGIYQQKNLGTFLKCVEVIEETIRGCDDVMIRRLEDEMMSRCDDVMICDKNPLQNLKGCRAERGGVVFSTAIKNLYKNTGFMGRWQVVSENPLTLCDVAHNSAGIELVMKQLQSLSHNHLHIIFGFVNDKDLDEIIPLLSKNATYYACQAQIERAMPADELCAKLSLAKLNVLAIPNVISAYNQALTAALPHDLIFIGGSFFVVGEFLQNC